MNFRNKQNYVKADQWFKNGDHPNDRSVIMIDGIGGEYLSEGEVVAKYVDPLVDPEAINPETGFKWREHGWIPSSKAHKPAYSDFGTHTQDGEPGLIVRPGDWILTENPTRTQGDPEFYHIYRGDFLRDHDCYETPRENQLKDLNARLLWHVNYNGRECPVYDIPTRFNYQDANGNTNHYWVLWGGELFPYGDRHTNRIVHKFTFEEYNSAKSKWNDMSTSRGVKCTIEANGRPMMQFSALDMEYAMAKAQTLLVKMREHSFNFYNPEEENGRRIYFYNLPATIRIKSTPGEISIHPDYVEGWTRSIWWKEYANRSIRKPYDASASRTAEADFEDDMEDLREQMDDAYINWGSALSDGNIWWHREDPDKNKAGDPGAPLSAG